jgi:hypothetical protein
VRYRNEFVRVCNSSPWRTVEHLELATLDGVDWFIGISLLLVRMHLHGPSIRIPIAICINPAANDAGMQKT